MPSTVIPGLRYRDAHAAIEWLVRVLGFSAHAVFEGPDNTVAHAQLTHATPGVLPQGRAADTHVRRVIDTLVRLDD